MNVAFLGTGLMGEPMASRLVSAGHPVVVWNRSPEKLQRLSAQGAVSAATPIEAVTQADVAFMMLTDGPAVSEVLSGMLQYIAAGVTVIDMSSIPPDLARTHGKLLFDRGVKYLDAPVSGGTVGATDGTLAIMVGGTSADFEAARPLFEIMGRPTLVGPVGSGQLAKLANQAIVATTIAAVAEALLLAAAGGADPHKVREALAGGFADSRILSLHGQRMLDRSWLPGGLLRTQVKDLRAIGALTQQLGLQLPAIREVTALFESGLKSGFGSFDHSALLLELERRNPGARVGTRADESPDP